MRIFVTGSTGFVGTAVVRELLSAGHSVLGLTRSDKGAEQLRNQGSEPLQGTLEDLAILERGARECDGVIHLAFVHDFANFEVCCAKDRAAISAIGEVLAAAAGNRFLVVTSGTMMLRQGHPGKEDDAPDTLSLLSGLRSPSEAVCLGFAERGVRASVVRLPPSTHGPGPSGFFSLLVKVALEKGVSGYIGDGRNCWSAGHRDDAAKLYRLAVEKAAPGSVFHAVVEEGVPVKDVATKIGENLGVPVVSVSPEEAPEHFGHYAFVASADNPATSMITREKLEWVPSSQSLMDSVASVIEYVKADSANHSI